MIPTLSFESVTHPMKSSRVHNSARYQLIRRINHGDPSQNLPKTLTWFTQWALASNYFLSADTVHQLCGKPEPLHTEDTWYSTLGPAIPWFHDVREEHLAEGYRRLTLAHPQK